MADLRRRDLTWTVNVAAACSEMRTPLTVLGMQVALLEPGLHVATAAGLATMGRNLRRLQAAVDQLSALTHERGPTPRSAPSAPGFDLASLALEVAREYTVGPARGTVEVLVGRDIQVLGDRGLLAASLGQLLEAVRVQAGPGGYVLVESAAGSREVLLCIRAMRAQEPVPHGGENGAGDGAHGLGLRVARELFERQGFRVQGAPDGPGLCVTLPLARGGASPM